MSVFLPDDVVLEILVRVKDAPAALFRCATACKRWRRLVADSSFLRRCWPEDALVGFFLMRRCSRGQLCFVPAPPRSVLGGHRRLLDSLVQSASVGLLNRAVPLVSRHGLLLVRLTPPDADILQLAVCNLHARAIHVLPPLSCGLFFHDHGKWSGYALLAGADCGSNSKEQQPVSASFKAVIIDSRFSLSAFSSDGAGWSAPIECFQGRPVADEYVVTFCHNDAVVRRGTAHWLFYDWDEACLRTIDMDGESGHVSGTKIPLSLPRDYDMLRPRLSLDVDGRLSVIYTHMRMGVPELEIWGPRGDAKLASEWLCTRKISLKRPDEKADQENNKGLHVLGEKCGTMFIREGDRVYVVDLRTEVAEEVVDWPHNHRVSLLRVVVPWEMDWASIFVSRLGTQCGS